MNKTIKHIQSTLTCTHGFTDMELNKIVKIAEDTLGFLDNREVPYWFSIESWYIDNENQLKEIFTC